MGDEHGQHGHPAPDRRATGDRTHHDDGHEHEHDHRHDHGHGGHAHGGHGHGARSGRGLAAAVVLNGGLAVAQVVAGVAFSSVAVFADAGHQVVDAIGLTIGWLALRLARRPATDRRTWGWGRADALGAQVSGVVLLASLAWVVVEAIRRLAEPQQVAGTGVLVIGLVGVAVNGGSLLVIDRAAEQLSMRAARLHLLADLAGSVLLVVTGGLIRATGWDRLDPIMSLVLSVSLVHSTVQLLRHSTGVLLDVAPAHLDVAAMAETVRREAGVLDLHHVHVWTVAPGVSALSAHVQVEGERSVHEAQHEIERVETLLRERFGIGHTTLQLECHPCARPTHDGPG